MQQDLLVTSYQIRYALGDTYQFLKGKDSKREFRHHQGSLKNLLKNEAMCDKLTCALCRSEPISVAHIESLEEGGGNDQNNLIPLCQACHKAFDDGYASQNEMRRVRKSWPTGDGSWLKKEMRTRQEMLSRGTCQQSRPAGVVEGKKEEIRRLIKGSQYDNAETKIGELKRGCSSLLECWLKISLLEVNRRRGKCGQLEEAAGLADELSKTNIPQECESNFYYQAGYANLELGRHPLALHFFRSSLQKLPRDMNWRHVATRMLILQTTVAGRRQDFDWNKAEEELLALQEFHLVGENNEAERRWQHNCALSAVRFYLARGRNEDIEHASSSWSQASKLWADMTLNTGWQRDSRSTIGYVKGYLVAAKVRRQKSAQQKELRRALGALARGIVLLIGKGWNFPQESRDLLFATGDVLEACGEQKHAKKVRDVARRIREGCSWKASHRADSSTQSG